MTSGTNKVAFLPGLCRHKLPQTVHHRDDTLPMHTWLSTSTLALDRQAIRGTSHGPLVSSDQEGLGFCTCSYSLSIMAISEAGSSLESHTSQLPTQIEGLTLNLRYPAMAPFKEVKSSFHQPIPHYSPNKSCYLQTTTSKSL